MKWKIKVDSALRRLYPAGELHQVTVLTCHTPLTLRTESLGTLGRREELLSEMQILLPRP